MERKKTSAVACALWFVWAASAGAQEYARDGIYVGAAGSFAVYVQVEDDLKDALGVHADISDPLGANGRIGYRFHPRLAGEVQFEWLSDANIEVLGVDLLDLGTWTLTANGKAYLATGTAQPFLLVGIGATRAKLKDSLGLGFTEKETDFAARFGSGIDVYLSPHVAITVDATYVLETGDLDGLDFFALGWGLQYRF